MGEQRISLFIFLVLISAFFPEKIYAQYPVIEEFRTGKDSHYYEQQQDIALYYRHQSNPDLIPELILFQYAVGENDNLFSLAASLNLPYETLATLNGWDNPDVFPRQGEIILIPNLPGLFIPVQARTDFEHELTRVKRLDGLSRPLVFPVRREAEVRDYYFFAGSRFTTDERKAFLGGLFRLTLPKTEITSRYGYRIHPVTGEWSFHHGIDLRLNTGTPLYPARSGTVKETDQNEIFGLYIIVSHDNGFETLYGHLDKILVAIGERVDPSHVLGLSGNTGLSSGPHLHFGIIKDGKPVNPELYLRGIQNEKD